MHDCLVIGGGIVGLMTARELLHEGMSIALLDKDEPGKACSWAGGGILTPLYPWRELDELSELIRWGQHQYPQIADELLDKTGIDPEWTESGLLIQHVKDRKQALTWAHQTGTLLEAGEAEDSLWLPEAAQIRNPRLLSALILELKQAGVSIHPDTEATRLLIHENRIRGVDTATGPIEANQVVIASGAWSRSLLNDIRVRPMRGQMLCFRGEAGALEHMLLRDGIYIIPRRDGILLVGSTVEDTGFDNSTTADARIFLSERAEQMWPGITDYPLIAQWSGLRPAVVSGIPYIGEYPGVSGLFINTGHFRNGILLAPGSTRLLTDSILRRDCPINPDIFRQQFSPEGPEVMA